MDPEWICIHSQSVTVMKMAKETKGKKVIRRKTLVKSVHSTERFNSWISDHFFSKPVRHSSSLGKSLVFGETLFGLQNNLPRNQSGIHLIALLDFVHDLDQIDEFDKRISWRWKT